MELITKKDMIDNIVERWTGQYPYPYKKDITEKLKQLSNPTEDSIAEVIGNRSWTSNKCTECGEEHETLVQLGEELDYDSSTVHVCIYCLEKAIDVIKGSEL